MYGGKGEYTWNTYEERGKLVERLSNEGNSISTISDLTGISAGTVGVLLTAANVRDKYPDRQGGEWLYGNAEERKERVEQLVMEGKDVPQIAEVLGVSPETIKNDVVELNRITKYVESDLPATEQNITIESRLVQVALLWRRGDDKITIARKLGVSPATITKDFRILLARWRESSLVDYNEAKTLQLEKLKLLQQEHWEAYEKSKEPEVIRIKKEGYTPDGDFEEEIVQKKERIGDYKNLAELRKIYEQEALLQDLKPKTTIKIETWRDSLVNAYNAKQLTENDLIESLGEDLAVELINAARAQIR